MLISDYLVDFDQVFTSPSFPTLGSTPVPNGSIIDTMYQSYGVTFSCVTMSRSFASTSCTSGHVFANFSASSGNNIVTPLIGLQPFEGRARFAEPIGAFQDLHQREPGTRIEIGRCETLHDFLGAPALAQAHEAHASLGQVLALQPLEPLPAFQRRERFLGLQ